MNQKGNGPVWLPDNRRLLFTHEYKIYLIDSQTKAARALRLPPRESADNPVIYPDGRYLYYSVDDNEESIWLITLK